MACQRVQFTVLCLILGACGKKEGQPVTSQQPTTQVVHAPQPTATDAGVVAQTAPAPVNLEALRAAHLLQLTGVSYAARPAFDGKNVPLGITLDTFKKQVPQCRISKPEGALSIDALIGFEPPFTDLFPLVRGVYLGTVIYYGTIPGLNRRHATKYEMMCGSDEYQLAVLDSTKQIFLFRKTLFVKGGGPRNQFDEARLALGAVCTKPLGAIHEARWRDRFGDSGTVPAFATSCDQGFMRIVLGSSTSLTGVYSPRHLGITYIDSLAWEKYLTKCRAEVEPTGLEKESLKNSF